jgi:hypothetical protein
MLAHINLEQDIYSVALVDSDSWAVGNIIARIAVPLLEMHLATEKQLAILGTNEEEILLGAIEAFKYFGAEDYCSLDDCSEHVEALKKLAEIYPGLWT